jgi:CO/xanthine dehydrogenase Mo-binding subunit
LPGVVAVLTHADVPRNEMCMELPGRMAEATAGVVLVTQPVLAVGRVRFHGEPVVAIAAETPEIVAEAAELARLITRSCRTSTIPSMRFVCVLSASLRDLT